MKTSVLAGLGLTMALLPLSSSAGVIGMLGNFDVINDTGKTAHGFEIELEGLHASDITDTFGGAGRGFPSGRGFDPANSVVRYGSPTITEYSNGGELRHPRDLHGAVRWRQLGLRHAQRQLHHAG